MTPTLLQGDIVALLFIHENERHCLSLGEVVLSFRDGQFALHRVVGVTGNPRRYITKGDALDAPDGRCSPAYIIARATHATTPEGRSFEIGKRPLRLFERLRLLRNRRLRWLR